MTEVTTSTTIDAGSTAWMLVSSALVLLMVPGLALFYGGLVRRKNVLTTMLQSFAAMGLIGVQWILVGYALAFGASYGGWIGWKWGHSSFPTVNVLTPAGLGHDAFFSVNNLTLKKDECPHFHAGGRSTV